MRHWINAGIISALLGLLGACAGVPDAKLSNTENTPVTMAPIEMMQDTVGPGDEVEVRVFRHDELQRRTRVPASGLIMLPLIGEISVNGISTDGLRKVLTEKYTHFIVNPQVSIDVVLQRSTKIMVLGEVRLPGVFYMANATTALEAVSLAGGFTKDAKMNEVMLLRGMPNASRHFKIDLDAALVAGAFTENSPLLPGDVLYIPPSTMANVDRFFLHLENILRPTLYLGQSIVVGDQARKIIKSDNQSNSTTNVIISAP